MGGAGGAGGKKTQSESTLAYHVGFFLQQFAEGRAQSAAVAVPGSVLGCM